MCLSKLVYILQLALFQESTWQFGLVSNIVGHVNEVNQCQAWLVTG